jgi:hypothetical protein
MYCDTCPVDAGLYPDYTQIKSRTAVKATECEGVNWIHNGSGQGPVAGSCECDNEPSGSVRGGEFLYQLSHY